MSLTIQRLDQLSLSRAAMSSPVRVLCASGKRYVGVIFLVPLVAVPVSRLFFFFRI